MLLMGKCYNQSDVNSGSIKSRETMLHSIIQPKKEQHGTVHLADADK